MAIDATPGSSTANSFATLPEFELYAETRVPASAWFASAGDDQKEAALIAGMRLLDGYFLWTGAAVDEIQSASWPRSGMRNRNGFQIPTSGASSIPLTLKHAQCEMAIQLGEGIAGAFGGSTTLEQGITSIKAGPVALTFSDVLANQNSYESGDLAIRLKHPELAYLQAPTEVRNLLVPSWYLQESVVPSNPWLFQVSS